ncbi:MAG: DUF5818 domain-containing protein [Candidatus Acidiferrales bacterium]
MKRIVLSVATLTLASGAVIFGASPKAAQAAVSHSQDFATQEQTPAQPEVKTFTGTIAKSGELFILREESSKSSYGLDDQESAGKFAGKRVKVTGVLDASNNTIRVQSIEAANA